MSLPRFYFEEDEDDATTPAQFVLKLPESYLQQRLATLKTSAPQTISRPTPASWMIEPPQIQPVAQQPWSLDRAKLVAVVASAFAFIIIVAIGVGASGSTTSSAAGDGPVGISHHAPKRLEKHVRTADRQRGFAPEVSAVSIETLQRSHKHRWR